METLPEPGSNYSVHATLRLIPKDSKTSSKISKARFIGKSVMLEPIDLPGMVIVHGKNARLKITHSSESNANASGFRLVAGLDMKKDSVSLESESNKECYVCSYLKLLADVKLSCISESSGTAFKQAASFTLRNGISKYDPISFVAKGKSRNFVLQPLQNIRDENYVVYFHILS